MEMVKDPVCGMEVNPKETSFVSEYEGKTYYFCCAGCKKSFDKAPEDYIGGGHGGHGGHHHGHGGHHHGHH